MTDSLLKIGYLIHERPGAYGLLLGAGVSTGAGIKQAHEIVADLLQRLAAADGHRDDAASWISSNYGNETPGLDALLEKLASHHMERKDVLAPYFEPAREEQERRARSAAHAAIAELVKRGRVRLVLTTNFDALLEQAIEKAGFTPDVIISDSDLENNVLDFSKAYVVKLSGDYRKVGLKATPTELAEYSASVNSFLDRVLRDYGWIVCGWSSRYDAALRNAFLRVRGPRSSTFWLQFGDLSPEAKLVCDHLKAEIVAISSADDAFNKIIDVVHNLDRLAGTGTLSLAATIATAKRMMDDPTRNTALRDYFETCSDELLGHVTRAANDLRPQADTTEVLPVMDRAEVLAENCIGLAATVSKYDRRGDHTHLVTGMVERLTLAVRDSQPWSVVRGYPALLVMYAATVVALHNRNWGAALAAFYNPQIKNILGMRGGPAATLLDIWGTLEPFQWKPPESPEYAFPRMTERIRGALRRILAVCGHSDAVDDLDETSSLLEYLLSLAILAKWNGLQSYTKTMWDVAWEMRSNGSALLKFTNSGAVYPLIQAGFLGQSYDIYESTSAKLAKLLEAKKDWLVSVR